jgi:adenine-specific DNA-methyltransferase
VDREKLDEAAFGKLSAAEQKRLLTELVDANCLYINYSDIDSGDYQISEADKRINRLFYGE